MDLEKRNCVLKDENLNGTGIDKHIFNDYSKEGCLLECKARMLNQRCGCLPYYFPDFSSYLGKNDTICNETQLQCLSDNTGEDASLVLLRVGLTLIGPTTYYIQWL